MLILLPAPRPPFDHGLRGEEKENSNDGEKGTERRKGTWEL